MSTFIHKGLCSEPPCEREWEKKLPEFRSECTGTVGVTLNLICIIQIVVLRIQHQKLHGQYSGNWNDVTSFYTAILKNELLLIGVSSLFFFMYRMP